MSNKSASTETRSSNGCWTCRLRRKKCDEARLRCINCNSLQISCFGYGPKPEWMDGGVKEKAVAKATLDAVRQTTARNRNRRLKRSQNPPESNSNSDSAVSLHTPKSTTTVDVFEREPSAGEVGQDVDFYGASMQGVSINTQLPATSQPNKVPSDTGSATLLTPVSLNGGDNFDIDTSSMKVDQEVNFYDSMTQDMNNMTSQQPSLLQLDTFSMDTNSLYIPTNTFSQPFENLTISKQPRSLSMDSYSSNLSDSIEEKNASSMMDYMDSVFFLQFPLQGQFSTVGGRGWLLWILMHVRPLRMITDALCRQCHRTLQLQPGGGNFNFLQDSEVEGCFPLLLSELNHYIGRVSQQHANIREGKIGILACTVQLIFLEGFQSGSLTWRTHLKAASSLVSFLTSNNFISQEISTLCNTAYDEAYKFFAGLFVWFDIISAASMGTKHLLQEVDEQLLESNDIDLWSLVGCENWIAVTILKITALHQWKKERELDGRLSFAELVRRSEPLERRLKESLNRLPSSIYQHTLTSDQSDSHGNSQRDIITSIYVGSALSYLHFVVSGPYSELIEMRESIVMTIEAFKRLPHPWLLRSLAWPFCVTGCFAQLEERDLLRDLVAAAGVNDPTGGTLWKALEVVEQCWKIQETDNKLCDWMQGARSLGYDILFI